MLLYIFRKVLIILEQILIRLIMLEDLITQNVAAVLQPLMFVVKNSLSYSENLILLQVN